MASHGSVRQVAVAHAEDARDLDRVRALPTRAARRRHALGTHSITVSGSEAGGTHYARLHQSEGPLNHALNQQFDINVRFLEAGALLCTKTLLLRTRRLHS